MSPALSRLLLLALSIPVPIAAQEVIVRTDRRIELVSALFRAGGREEYRQGRVVRWNAALDSVIAAHATHDALPIVTRLAQQYNVGYFSPISLAIHLDADPPMRLRPGLARAPSLHRNWTTFPDSTVAFVAAFEEFAVESHFEAFLGQQRELLSTAEDRLRRLVGGDVRGDWFRRFWGDTSIARLTIVPGLTAATASYGLDVAHPDGSREGFAVIGVTKVDAAGMPRFDSTDVSIIVHELNHPYVTGALRRAPPELRGVADTLYRGVATALRRIGYGSADAMLNEALVRAAVIRYLAANRSPEAAARETEGQRAEGFVWIGEIAAAMGEYEADRARYPTFVEFLPVLVERLRAIADAAGTARGR